jgi:hypothetical protein
MALSGLDLRQPDLSGLSYLAGKSGQLGIDPRGPGGLGLQALQAQYNQENAQHQQALQQMQLQQQGQLGLGQQDIQRQQLDQQAQQAQQRQGLLQQQLQQQQAQQGFQNGMAQQQMANQQQQQGFQNQLAMDSRQQQQDQQNMQQHMQQVADMSKDELQQKGAFASYALMSLQSAKSPAEAQQIGQAIYKDAVDKKYLTQDQADQLSKLPLSQQQNAMKAMVISMGQSKQYKDMNPQQAGKGVAGGASISYDANGNPVITVAPTKGVTTSTDENGNPVTTTALTPAESTDAQKKSVMAREMLDKLSELRDTYSDKYLTAGGRWTGWTTGEASTYKDVPGLGPLANTIADATSAVSPDPNNPNQTVQQAREKFLGDRTNFLHSAGQIFQQYIQSIAGSRPSAERVKQLEALFANPSMSPIEYKAGLDQLIRDIGNQDEGFKSLLTKGLDVTPSQQPANDLRSFLKSQGHSDADIDTYMKNRRLK